MTSLLNSLDNTMLNWMLQSYLRQRFSVYGTRVYFDDREEKKRQNPFIANDDDVVDPSKIDRVVVKAQLNATSSETHHKAFQSTFDLEGMTEQEIVNLAEWRFFVEHRDQVGWLTRQLVESYIVPRVKKKAKIPIHFVL